MVVSKKSLGVIVLLFIPCFAAGQNCVDSTTVKQDSIALELHSICQRDVMSITISLEKTVVNSSIDYLLFAKSKD